MIRKNIWKWGVAATAVCVFAFRAYADTVKVPVRVVDQDGNAVAGAKLDSDTGSVAVSDGQGKAVLEVRKRALYNRFYARKEGYYPTETHGKYSPLAKDFDSSKPIVLSLKQIKNPIPMFVRNYRAEGCGILKLPKYNGEKYAYDLVVGDWVAPYGKGNSADFIFQFKGNAGRVVGLDEWEQKFILSFSREHDGIIAWKGSSEAGRKYGSELESDYNAPVKGYQSEWVQRTWKEKGGCRKTTRDIDRNFYFRVRTKTDGKGNIISAHYGKIYGDFMSFIYYLNPTPNDRNVEFAPKKNLFKITGNDVTRP